jgi:aromatic ring-opening dioxygenase catalytic subunit (LigB family)
MQKRDSDNNGQIIYISHGGGPLPVLNDPAHGKMINFMRQLPDLIRRPDSIIVFSAHWEENIISIQSAPHPEVMYDYYGFPEAAYRISYPCTGNPQLAEKVSGLLQKSGILQRMDDERSYDHGSYIPLRLMYPKAGIPVIQVSLDHSLDPLTHLKIGSAIRPLLKENILIIGSGFSFHNMRQFDFEDTEYKDPRNDEFQNRLIKICCASDEQECWRELAAWVDLPQARYCHPREEHLLPLHVCAGMANSRAELVFDDYILGKRAVAFLWR